MFLKKHGFFVWKKKYILIFLSLILIITSVIVYFSAIRPTFQPKPLRTIVIDAGHGGIDGGAVGKSTGTDESHLNLDYALTLQDLCQDYGIRVILTRADMNGLYSLTAPNKKRSEMQKRQKIIEESGADLVISIHMNSFPLSTARGAQVYYSQDSENGKRLADSVQTALNTSIDYAKKTSKAGDFYILNCTDKPSILIECGFLSNVEEEKLLISESYRKSMCYSMLVGIMKYFDM